MRIGTITQLLWPRYGALWDKLLTGAGVEVLRASPDAVRDALGDARVEAVSGFAFRLAAAEALALESADAILAPDLNPGADSPRGSGQDPFVASFPEALGTFVNGLPPIVSVPASLTGDLETLVVSTLHALTRDPGLVRRMWERHRSSAKAPKVAEPRWRVRPSEGGTVGLIGQPWLLREPVVQMIAAGLEAHLVSQHQLDPAALQAEGQRVDERLISTDSEVLGAARYLGRKGSVVRLMMIADKTSGTDAWLVSKVQKLTHKPLDVRYLQDLQGSETLIDAFLS